MRFCSALYAHKISTNYWHNVTTPEESGFASKLSAFLSTFQVRPTSYSPIVPAPMLLFSFCLFICAD
jgi:hypothetical protein